MSTRDEKVHGWLAGRLPKDWYTETPDIRIDRDEITIIGRVEAPTTDEDAADAERAAAEAGRIKQFREDTRDARIRIARELEHAAGRKVAWGATCGGTEELFTTISVPVMTRLRATPASTAAAATRWPGASSSSDSTATTGSPSCAKR